MVNENMKTSNDSPRNRKDHQNVSQSDETKSSKRRRDADQRILDQFWVICDQDPLKRQKSLKMIIEILIKQNETNNSSDLMYCLDRVIRGMASARQYARHGFCVLLTQMLSIFESKISLELVFSLSEKHLGKMDELSTHDSVIGWSLVIASAIKSQRLSSEGDKEIYEKTFQVLYNLGMNKPYIELVVCELFTQYLGLMSDKKVIFEKIVAKSLKEDMKTDNKYKPFFVFCCLSIAEHFSNFSDKSLRNNLKFMATNDSLQRLSIMIRESTAYHPSVHPFIRQIIKIYMTDTKTDFQNFWNQCIDFVLFSPNQIEKGNLGFELIKISVEYIKSTENISTILSPSFVRLFIQSLSVKTHPLHNASHQLCDFFVNHIKTIDDSELQLEFVNCFTKQPGSLLFDDISRSKFFSNLLRNLNSISIKEWTQRLKIIFLTTNKVESNDILRIRCIQQITNVSKSLTSDEETDILWSNIRFLFFHSYFDANSQTIEETLKTPVVPIGDRLRSSLKDGFRNTFNHLLNLSSKTSKEKLSHETQILSLMVEFANDLVSNNSIKCLIDSNSLEPFHTIARKVLRLKKKLNSNESKEIEIKIFISLHSVLAIQLFEEYEEIQNIILDLNECMKRAISEESVEEDSGPVWADVLTDLIISMLTTTSKLTKNVLLSCFKHICSQISNVGIQSLVDAIIPSNDNQLFGGNEDSDEEDEESEEENGESDKSEIESDTDSEDENQNPEIDEKFRNDVINALGPAADNDDDEESVYLTDDEMCELDETLASVFKAKFSDKKELLEKRNSITAFRLRCFDLVHIFLSHRDISLDQVFIFIEPIVTVAKSSTQPTKQNQLSVKAIQLIRQMTKVRDSGDNSLEVNYVKNILNNLLTVLSKNCNSELQKALIPLLIWIITLSKKLFTSDDWYYSDIETALKSFFEKTNCQIPALFFKNLINVHNEIGFKLFDIFLDYGFQEEIRPFKKAVAIEELLILCKTRLKNVNTISTKELIGIREKCLKMLIKELTVESLKIQYVRELLKLFACVEKDLKEQSLQMSDNDYQELTIRLRSLSKIKRRKLSVKEIVRRITSNTI